MNASELEYLILVFWQCNTVLKYWQKLMKNFRFKFEMGLYRTSSSGTSWQIVRIVEYQHDKM